MDSKYAEFYRMVEINRDAYYATANIKSRSIKADITAMADEIILELIDAKRYLDKGSLGAAQVLLNSAISISNSFDCKDYYHSITTLFHEMYLKDMKFDIDHCTR